MTELLLKIFVKNYKDAGDPKVHSAIGRFAGITGIVCNFLLTVWKMTVGILAGSMAIISDAVNNLSDACSSVITLLGFKLAQRPADKDHPYGHARIEYIAGLAVSVLILLAGAELVRTSVEKILSPAPLSISLSACIVLLLSIIIKLWLFIFFRGLGKRIGSVTLRASAIDSRNDVITTVFVCVGCLVNYFTNINIDGYVGLIVALFIIFSGIKIAKSTVSPLLGQQADKELIDKISELILSHEKVLGIHELLIHDYGPGQCYASVHVEFSVAEGLLACRDAIDSIESDALEKMNVHLVIHYDPIETGIVQKSSDKT